MAVGKKTGGRTKGVPNRKTAERQAAIEAAVEKINEKTGGRFDGDAHALLVLVYRDVSLPLELRQDAAKAAIRYEKPALASTVVTHRDAIDDLNATELRLLLAAAERAAGIVREESAGEAGAASSRKQDSGLPSVH